MSEITEDFTAPTQGGVAVQEPVEVQVADVPVEVPTQPVGEVTGTTEAKAEQPAAPAKPAGPSEEEIATALAAFTEVLDEVTGVKVAEDGSTDPTVGKERDETTGAMSEDLKLRVQMAFAKLPRGNTKASARPKAKDLVDERLHGAMETGNMPVARTLFTIVQECLTVRGSGGEGAGLVVKVDPTEDFVGRVTALSLAPYALTPGEDVDADWPQRVEALVNELVEHVQTYATWVQAESQLDAEGAETRGDEPEVHDLVKQAAGIAFGRRAAKRAPRATKSGGSTTTGERVPFDGVRRSVGKHIEQAFNGQPVGTWMSIAQIAAFDSEEYRGGKPVSQGAISARIYASGGCSVAGVEPRENSEGKKGAVKTA